MLDKLNAWLNSSKDYDSGVLLYESLQHKADLLVMFKKGVNEFRKHRLHQVLQALAKEMKDNPFSGNISVKATNGTGADQQVFNNPVKVLPVNQELYNAAIDAADKQYKELMNLRAVLFSTIDANSYDPNTTERVAIRCKPAIAIVRGFQAVSQLYEDAAFVKANGYPPDQGEPGNNDYENLPDDLVKQKLDNLRKNYSKMNQREVTPARFLLLQKHKANIEKLAARWQKIKYHNC